MFCILVNRNQLSLSVLIHKHVTEISRVQEDDGKLNMEQNREETVQTATTACYQFHFVAGNNNER